MPKTTGGTLTTEQSSASTSTSRRQVIVELLKDVEGLGKACVYTFLSVDMVFGLILLLLSPKVDRIRVAPGRARNSLVPYRYARFVPYAKGVNRNVMRQDTAMVDSHEALLPQVTDQLVRTYLSYRPSFESKRPVDQSSVAK